MWFLTFTVLGVFVIGIATDLIISWAAYNDEQNETDVIVTEENECVVIRIPRR